MTPQPAADGGPESSDRVPAGASGPSWGPWTGVTLLCSLILLQAAFGALLVRGEGGLAALLRVGGASDVALIVLIFAVLRSGRGLRAVAGEIGLGRPRAGFVGPALKVLAAGALAYVACLFALSAAVNRFGVAPEGLPLQPLVRMIDAAESPVLIAMATLLAVIVAPVAEEMLFRSALYLPLRARLGVVPAALLVSLLFAAFHRYPLGVANLVVLSLTFVALLEYTGSLWVPIVAHGLYNALIILLVRLVSMPGGA